MFTLKDSNNNYIIPYTQITNIIGKTNCKLDYIPSDINSLSFVFENCTNVIPGIFQIYDGMFFTDFSGVKIVYITKNSEDNDKFDKDGNVYYRYYDDPYVHENYKYALKNKYRFKELIGCYFVDWSDNQEVLDMIKDNNSTNIQLMYYISREQI
jgi:hypothetical protein